MFEQPGRTWSDLLDFLAAEFVRRVDAKKLSQLDHPEARRESRMVVEYLFDEANPLVNRMERERAIDEVMDNLFGYGPLGSLLCSDGVEEIDVSGPDRIQVRPETASDCIAPFRGLEQLYLICARLLGQEPVPGSVVERAVDNFWLTARIPGSRQAPPTLHFRRVRRKSAPVELPPPRLPQREQRLFVRFVAACHAAALDEYSSASVLRELAEQVVDELLAESPAHPGESVRACLVQTMLDEFQAASGVSSDR
jgi:hypothetical protein